MCNICEDKGYVLTDYPDHNGEHQQIEIHCECQLEDNQE